MRMFKVKLGKKKEIEKGIDLVSQVRKDLKKSDIAKTIASKYGLEDQFEDIIDGVAIYFNDFAEDGMSDGVSARTTDGVVSLNNKLMDNIDHIMEYVVHEFTHVCQHIVNEGSAPKKHSGKYIEKPEELEAFHYQVQQIQEDKGDEESLQYIRDLLDYHKIKNPKKRKTLERLLLKGE